MQTEHRHFYARAVEDLRPVIAQEFGEAQIAEQLVFVVKLDAIRAVDIEDIRFGIEPQAEAA